MPRAAVRLVLVLALGLSACAQTTPTGVVTAGQTRPAALQACDDGGDGGVMIDGICL